MRKGGGACVARSAPTRPTRTKCVILANHVIRTNRAITGLRRAPQASPPIHFLLPRPYGCWPGGSPSASLILCSPCFALFVCWLVFLLCLAFLCGAWFLAFLLI